MRERLGQAGVSGSLFSAAVPTALAGRPTPQVRMAPPTQHVLEKLVPTVPPEAAGAATSEDDLLTELSPASRGVGPEHDETHVHPPTRPAPTAPSGPAISPSTTPATSRS